MKSLPPTKFTALLLSIPFIVIYFVVRSLPVEQCDFLHEETYNLEGELDYCGPGDDGFVDLSIRRWPDEHGLPSAGSFRDRQAMPVRDEY